VLAFWPLIKAEALIKLKSSEILSLFVTRAAFKAAGGFPAIALMEDVALSARLKRIGARTLVMDSDEHDRVVALTSHLPQLASTALAAALEERLGAAGRPVAAGPGLADATRLALSSYDLWRDILATNTGHIDRALAIYIQELEHIRENLRTRQLQEEFQRAATFAGRLRGTVQSGAPI